MGETATAESEHFPVACEKRIADVTEVVSVRFSCALHVVSVRFSCALHVGRFSER